MEILTEIARDGAKKKPSSEDGNREFGGARSHSQPRMLSNKLAHRLSSSLHNNQQTLVHLLIHQLAPIHLASIVRHYHHDDLLLALQSALASDTSITSAHIAPRAQTRSAWIRFSSSPFPRPISASFHSDWPCAPLFSLKELSLAFFQHFFPRSCFLVFSRNTRLRQQPDPASQHIAGISPPHNHVGPARLPRTAPIWAICNERPPSWHATFGCRRRLVIIS